MLILLGFIVVGCFVIGCWTDRPIEYVPR